MPHLLSQNKSCAVRSRRRSSPAAAGKDHCIIPLPVLFRRYHTQPVRLPDQISYLLIRMYAHCPPFQFKSQNVQDRGSLFTGRIEIAVPAPQPHTQPLKEIFDLRNPGLLIQCIDQCYPAAVIAVRTHFFIGKVALAVPR